MRTGSLRVEWQLYELDGGEFHRCPPKDDSYRTIDTPDFLSGLLSRHISAKRPEPCRCHDLRYAFNGYSAANGAAGRPGAKIVDVARKAGVSAGTVSNVRNWPGSVSEGRRLRAEAAIAELGYVRNASSGELAAHWRRSGLASWLYPATTGSYPARAPYGTHPSPSSPTPGPASPGRAHRAVGRGTRHTPHDEPRLARRSPRRAPQIRRKTRPDDGRRDPRPRSSPNFLPRPPQTP
jgi:hypothetical protein